MANEVIHGKDCILELLDSGVYYPILCAEEFSFRLTQETIPTTTADSGIANEYELGLTDWAMTVSGLTAVENDTRVTIFYLMQEALRRQAQTVKATFTNEQSQTIYITGRVLFPSMELAVNVNDFGNATVEMQGTGAPSIGIVAPPTPQTEIVYSDVWTCTPGQAYIDGLSDTTGKEYSLISNDIEILEVDRSGDQYDVILLGTIGNRQCKYNSSQGRITFATDFEAGETVFVLFKVVS
jgi:hypothetical protein